MKIMGDEDIVRDALIKWEDGTYNETKLGMEGLIMTEPLTRSLAIYGLAEISAGEGKVRSVWNGKKPYMLFYTLTLDFVCGDTFVGQPYLPPPSGLGVGWCRTKVPNHVLRCKVQEQSRLYWKQSFPHP